MGIFLPRSPAIMPPIVLPSRYGSASRQGNAESHALINKEIKHIGRMMDMEAGNTSESSKSVKNVRSGTRIIPPPAPNRPLTIPAMLPAMAVFQIALRKKIASRDRFPREAREYALSCPGSYPWQRNPDFQS